VIAAWKVLDFNNGQEFYTDSNGLGMIKRVVRTQDNDEIIQKSNFLQSSANYYPITQGIVLEDKD